MRAEWPPDPVSGVRLPCTIRGMGKERSRYSTRTSFGLANFGFLLIVGVFTVVEHQYQVPAVLVVAVSVAGLVEMYRSGIFVYENGFVAKGTFRRVEARWGDVDHLTFGKREGAVRAVLKNGSVLRLMDYGLNAPRGRKIMNELTDSLASAST